MKRAMTGSYLLSAVVLLALAALAGCGATDAALPIVDLREIPQDCRSALGHGFADRTLIAPDVQTQLARDYRQVILSPWRDGYLPRSAEEVRALFDKYAHDGGCGENLVPRDAAWAGKMLPEANMGGYPNCRRRAISVCNTSIRQLPTAECVFRRPGKGQGYPFDQLQESAVWANTPLFVAHVSAGGAWAWAESSFAAGWAPAADVAFVDDAMVDAWRRHPLAAIVRDGVSLRGPGGAFIAREHIGAVLPLADAAVAAGSGPGDQPAAGLELLAAARLPDGLAKALRVRLEPAQAEIFPVPATTARLADLADRMLGQSYGWGGLYEHRDCSAMTRDLFAPLGLYLPRNSSEQARSGKVVPLGNMSGQAKERLILRDGAGMLTLLGAPGHIMLYLGQRDSKALIMHNTWGVKVREPGGDEGYKLIGRCCITTLAPGAELPNILLPEADLLRAIEVMVLLDGGDNFNRLKASPFDRLRVKESDR
jgi:cell wall-associated NlpC family hydrolase